MQIILCSKGALRYPSAQMNRFFQCWNSLCLRSLQSSKCRNLRDRLGNSKCYSLQCLQVLDTRRPSNLLTSAACAPAKMLQIALPILKQSKRIRGCKSDESYEDGEPGPHNPCDFRYFSNSGRIRRSKTNDSCEDCKCDPRKSCDC